MSVSVIIRRAARYLSPLVKRSFGYGIQSTVKTLNVQRHEITTLSSSRLYFTLPEIFHLSQEEKDKMFLSTAKESLGTKKPEKEIIDIIDSTIKINESHDTDKKEIQKLPFDIKDNTDEEVISLERDYENEKISIKVERRALANREDNISMTVTIDKESHICLGFDVRASQDSIQILRFFMFTKVSENLTNTDQEVKFSDFDEKMKTALHSYLDVRGIQPNIVKSLSEHVDKKMDSMTWLKDLKNFMEI